MQRVIGVGYTRGENAARLAVVRVIGAGGAMRVAGGAHRIQHANRDERRDGWRMTPARRPGPMIHH